MHHLKAADYENWMTGSMRALSFTTLKENTGERQGNLGAMVKDIYCP